MKAQFGLISGMLVVLLLGYQTSAQSRSAQPRFEPGEIQTAFVCDSTTHTCRCDAGGTDDCFKLGESRLCKEGTLKKDEENAHTLVCEFKY